MTGTKGQHHRDIYESLLGQDNVLGVPITIIAQEDIRLLATAYGVDVEKQTEAGNILIPEDLVVSYYRTLIHLITELQFRAGGEEAEYDDISKRVKEIFSSDNFKKFITATLITSLQDDFYNSYCYVLGDENDPHSALILSPRAATKAGKAVRQMLVGNGPDAEFAVPASDYQWLALALLHEFFHACNADEAQADKMAMLQLRRLFRNDDCLPLIQFWTDLRIVELVMLRAPQTISDLSARGFGMVEAGDLVLQIHDDVVQSMTDEDLKRLPSEEFDDTTRELLELGKILYDEHPEACEKRDLPAILMAARQAFAPCLDFETEPLNTQERIARRFVSGLERIIATMEP